ncbi:preprotein translocase subunit SecE [Solirubrobacter sp. CPCC 204708]|uniref:Protein translocase subunit SecE n=1 Tax=Solirubrobacter deserti TaxID=2282478 RepID=A0ABT4RMB2_9ACTN|nr:preprotein translocase subunit SecE [Solirubrobacter deserti]MBE2317995.1 preprotein translocase subunit SecE [Solirubrobacter deserti]MDA0139674.1 preprotein translocase subunit SecE [Solirubrobacter deserti]
MATDRPRRGSDDLEEDRVRNDEYARDTGDTEPADPLGQAMPDVTEAHLAEVGGDDRDRTAAAPPAPPEPPTGSGNGDSHEHGDAPVHRKGLFGRAADFLRASWAELRRVQWPDRRQVGQGTAVTLGFVVVAGAYLGLLDAIWNPLIQAIL